MGHVFVDAQLSWKRSARVRVLVDTGATHSVLPSDLADRLGVVRSPRPIRVELAGGSHRSMRVGTVLVRLLGREAGDTALIARPGAEAVLGVEALEALGLTVDPRSRKLKPSRARAVLLVSTRPARR
jgi:clan AA aspartic protease